MIETQKFGTWEGKDVLAYVLKNDVLDLRVLNYGATIQHLSFDGVSTVVGFDSILPYTESYYGKTIGRVSNRIHDGTFHLPGKTVKVDVNEGRNTLHGGRIGFDKRFFEGGFEGEKLVLRYLSPDGDMGFPGNLLFTVTFELFGASLRMTYVGKTDQDTAFAPTAHTYFNPDGAETGYCEDCLLTIPASRYDAVDDGLIPVKTKKVEGTVFDFRKEKAVKTDLSSPVLKAWDGYDTNYFLDPDSKEAATVVGPKTGVRIRLRSDMKCLQFYSGGKKQDGLALEPQFAPDSVNRPWLLQPILRAHQEAWHEIEYDFDRVSPR